MGEHQAKAQVAALAPMSSGELIDRQDEHQKVADTTDQMVCGLLDAILAAHPRFQFSILSGLMTAMVRFYVVQMIRPPEVVSQDHVGLALARYLASIVPRVVQKTPVENDDD
jgi:hypothetical protein